MARLRNRIVKADFWGDGDLLRWHRDKRTTYKGLWSVAEDSGCLEDDPFTWKLLLWPSPFDTDITVELLSTWRDELLDAGKLIAYEVEGRRYFFIEPFHRHEHPRNPQVNDLPLPPWVALVQHDSDSRKRSYEVDWDMLGRYINDPTGLEQPLKKRRTTVVQGLSPARPAQPSPAQPSPVLTDIPAPPVAREADPVDNPGGGGAEEASENGGSEPDRDNPILWELWALPDWQKSPKADAALIAQIRAECPGVSLDAVFADYRLSAGDTKIGQPRRFMLGRAKTLAERAGPEAPPDLVRPDMVASLAAMVADGGRPEDLRAMCASEAEYEAVLGHCSPAKKAAS